MNAPAHRPIELNSEQQQALALTDLERQLLTRYQQGLPLTPTPYAEMARELGTSEALVLRTLDHLQQIGVISRIGPVFAPKRIGASTLAAMAVPPQRLDEVAALVSACPEVNHNYEREHDYNLWFVATAPDQARLDAVLEEIARRSGLPVLDLPLQRQYHIDLGFALWC